MFAKLDIDIDTIQKAMKEFKQIMKSNDRSYIYKMVIRNSKSGNIKDLQ